MTLSAPFAQKPTSTSRATEAQIFADVKRDIERVSLDAGLHAWSGNDAITTIYLAGNLFFIVLGGAMCSGVNHSDPDLDIVRRGVDAITDLRRRPKKLEKHRPAIQAAILAVGRLMPRCDERQIVHAAVHLMTLIGQGDAAVKRFEEQVAA